MKSYFTKPPPSTADGCSKAFTLLKDIHGIKFYFGENVSTILKWLANKKPLKYKSQMACSLPYNTYGMQCPILLK